MAAGGLGGRRSSLTPVEVIFLVSLLPIYVVYRDGLRRPDRTEPMTVWSWSCLPAAQSLFLSYVRKENLKKTKKLAVSSSVKHELRRYSYTYRGRRRYAPYSTQSPLYSLLCGFQRTSRDSIHLEFDVIPHQG